MTETLAQLRQMAASDDVGALHATLVLWKFEKPSYTDWVNLVQRSLQYEVALVAKRRNDLQGLDENAITALLVIALQSVGLEASSAVVNGNCDLVVGYSSEYSWLGEAKIFTGVSAIWGGYLQLTKRYAVGLPGQNHGGMLLYCFKDNAKVLLAEWRATLAEQVIHADIRDGVMPLTFTSSDVCQASGLPLSILHYAFPLHHDPQEDRIKLSKGALAAAKEAKRAARKSS